MVGHRMKLMAAILAGTTGAAVLWGCKPPAPPAAGGTGATSTSAGARYSSDEFPIDSYFETDPTSPTRAAHRALEGKPAPPIMISEWIGPAVDLNSLKGKVVVVDFWATWCPPCMRSLPHNVQLAKEHEAEGLVFVGIHDSNRGWERAPQAIDNNRIKYSVGKDDGIKSVSAWNVQFWPTYGIIDRKGVLRAIGVTPDAVEPIVTKLLAEPA